MEALMTNPALVVDHLVLRTATEESEIDHLRQALNQGHYLQAGRPAGHVLWQGIYRTDTEADCPELRTLRHALLGLTDTRNAKAIGHPFSAMLALIIYGLICGAGDVKSIWQKCAPSTKNHWQRDTSLWKEDASRPRKKASGGQVLALLRGAVLRLHDQEAFESLNASFHHHSAKPYAALSLLKTPPPQIN